MGTTGLGALGYLAMWSAMSGAMMFSPLAWFASGYLRAIRATTASRSGAALRTASLVLGYVAVWLSTGVLALALSVGADELLATSPGAVPWAAAAALIGAGAYQLSSLKVLCLARCRSPLGFALVAAGLRGPLRDLRAGMLHGTWCVGCCWHLMLALIAVGTMELKWLVAVAVLILLERVSKRFEIVVRASGFALLVAGGLVPWVPALAPGLQSMGMS